ncbi:MAG: M15 family metallopeptidase [Flavobacteriaceae bacterium]
MILLITFSISSCNDNNDPPTGDFNVGISQNHSLNITLWNGGVIPYRFDSDFPEHMKPEVRGQMQIWQSTLLVKKSYLKEISPLSKSYKKGDKGEEVLKIKEWLMLWQLNENYVDFMLDLNTDFDTNTETLVKEVQSFMNLTPTGIVDTETWSSLVSPLKKAFTTDPKHYKTLGERMKYFATKHLQYRSAELKEDNIGPWIRSYMDGEEGGWAYWCQALACTVLDQTFSSIGERFDLYYANTWTCETMREHARNRNLLVTKQELLDREYVPKIGDIVLYIEGPDKKAHHTEIVYEILDSTKGEMLTIGGNTNFSGSRNGVGTFLVDRNFLTEDVEVVKMIDKEISNKTKTYPVNVQKLIRSYPDFIIGLENNHLIFKNGKKLLYNDKKKKSRKELLNNPSIKDQFFYPYTKGTPKEHPKEYDDPGRVTNEAFFKMMYGSTKEEVEANLVELDWCPKLLGEKVKVTTVNGVHQRLKQISTELDEHPELKPYITNIGGTYKWRKVSGTNRLSLHSYGIAIDINVSKSNYWQWDCKCKDEDKKLGYVNRIPQLIVDIFEKHGFIWGGKWYHYDSMHFEYRPEILIEN